MANLQKTEKTIYLNTHVKALYRILKIFDVPMKLFLCDLIVDCFPWNKTAFYFGFHSHCSVKMILKINADP